MYHRIYYLTDHVSISIDLKAKKLKIPFEVMGLEILGNVRIIVLIISIVHSLYTHLQTYLPACLPACLPTCLPVHQPLNIPQTKKLSLLTYQLDQLNHIIRPHF